MSKYPINGTEGDWQLLKREGKVEMWYNNKSTRFGVYLYERETDDDWRLHAIRINRQDAEQLFQAVVNIVR